MNLDFMPSPFEDRPGLLIRDSHGYSDMVLIIPPPLVECLECFDGEQTELDLRKRLVEITGDLDVSGLQQHLSETLAGAGFLHDDHYEQLRERRHREFADAPVREASHAGTAYPADTTSAKATLADYMRGGGQVEGADLAGIAAPHVSPFGGHETYRAAYSALGDEHRDRTFVVLGTSHYGRPERFGLTRKRFETPLGTARTDLRLVDELSLERAAVMEDYSHAVEHSIEFQVVYLQYVFGPDIAIVPVLCGSFARSLGGAGRPEDDDAVRSFFDRLGEINAREGRRLLWVLGIDMAHMGLRYGDPFAAETGSGRMEEVARRDRERIERVNAADSAGFWSLVRENQDDLKWCGSSPLYTFLKAVPQARGKLREYEQWNIDERSVVSFAALSFHRND
jgi:AmmeMemoRadiSam system protein B